MRVIRSAPRLLHLVYGTADEIARGQAVALVTAGEARRALDLSETGFRDLIGSGQIAPVAKFGKAHLFSAIEVEELRLRRGGA